MGKTTAGDGETDSDSVATSDWGVGLVRIFGPTAIISGYSKSDVEFASVASETLS